jgi:hypothetical protein
MKRFGLLIALAAIAAGGLVYTVRQAKTTPHAAVTALLPGSTIAFAHLPDFNQTRDEWHQTDIYRLYREPAVQDFLNKPLSRLPQRDAAAASVDKLRKLDPEDAFVAVTSVENNEPHLVGGFRFHGTQSKAEEIINQWRSQFVGNASTRESIDYEQHKIDIIGAAPNQMATVYDGQWFFASNDLSELKAVLDRVGGRQEDPQTALASDEAFRGAIAHMPSSYALLVYAQTKAMSEKLASLRNAIGASGDQNDLTQQIRSVCAATRFDKGKMRDVVFVGMPNAHSREKLTRKSLTLGSSETFFYLATLINPDRFSGINQPGSALPLGTWLQKVFDAAARAGVTVDDWKAAFDLELSSLADWPPSARWPSIISTMRVKDPARANKIVNALMQAIDEDATWTKNEKEGVVYFYMQTPAALFAITPTIALSNQVLIVGLDSVSVEAGIKRTANSSSTLEGLANYKSAERAVPPPTNAFVYVDTALLYTRLDAALRPMLLMSAAFMPAISDYVDVTKLPQPELVAKHLSPIVSSQRYDGEGYVTESVGPITLSEAAIGIGLPALLWNAGRDHTP